MEGSSSSQGAEGTRAQGENEEGLKRCPWNPLLAFLDPELESDFRDAQHDSWSYVDAQGTFLCLVGNPCKMLSWSTPGIFGTCIHHAWLSMHMILQAALYLCYKGRKWPYKNHKERLPVVACLQCLVCIMGTIITSYEDPNQMFAAKNLTVRILSRTPLTPLLVSAFAYRQPFRQMIVSQGLCTLATLPWIWSLETACKSHKSIIAAVTQLGYFWEQLLFLGISKSEDGVKHYYPWWQVGTFCHVLYGFVFPLSIIYVFEVRTRVYFLKNIKPTASLKQVSDLLFGSGGFAVFAAVIFLQIVWAVLIELQT